MTAARLSPAASLLRNSKLFALPPAIALPPSEPSSEPIPRPDSATTVYPTRAAIETAGISLFRGDWGLKRPLPLKSTVKSRVVRLNDGIDTHEHIADFDSATDHVLTLKKFQQLNQAIQHPRGNARHYGAHRGVFRSSHDNTTNVASSAPANITYTGVWPNIDPATTTDLPPNAARQKDQRSLGVLDPNSPSQASTSATISVSDLDKPQRWRYNGPSLIQLSGFEFDRYVQSLDSSKRKAFRDKVKESMIRNRRESASVAAREEGVVGEVDTQAAAVSEEEIDTYIRKLRQRPQSFGPLIAEFLDLPEGPSGSGTNTGHAPRWDYGRNTLAAEYYEAAGPPRTHPSAGLSYIHSAKFAQNDALLGPQHNKNPVVARIIKARNRGNKVQGNFGVAGFVVKPPSTGSGSVADIPAFEPSDGGHKQVVLISETEVNEQGALSITTKPMPRYLVQDDMAIHETLQRQGQKPVQQISRQQSSSRILPSLTRDSTNYKRREPIRPSSDVDDLLQSMMNQASSGSRESR